MRATLAGGIVLLGLLLAPSGARAQMTCQGQQIDLGATMDQVLQLCGAPQWRIRGERWIGTGLADSPVTERTRIPVVQWTYDRPGEFSRTLVFESGRLVKSQSGGYPDLPSQF